MPLMECLEDFNINKSWEEYLQFFINKGIELWVPPINEVCCGECGGELHVDLNRMEILLGKQFIAACKNCMTAFIGVLNKEQEVKEETH